MTVCVRVCVCVFVVVVVLTCAPWVFAWVRACVFVYVFMFVSLNYSSLHRLKSAHAKFDFRYTQEKPSNHLTKLRNDRIEPMNQWTEWTSEPRYQGTRVATVLAVSESREHRLLIQTIWEYRECLNVCFLCFLYSILPNLPSHFCFYFWASAG